MADTSIHAEQYVLGSMMSEADVIPTVSEILTSNSFAKNSHQEIYKAIMELYNNGEPILPTTVADRLQNNGVLDDAVGGLEYIVNLVSDLPSTAAIKHFCHVVRQNAQLRLAAKNVEDIAMAISNRDIQRLQLIAEDLQEILDNAETEHTSIIQAVAEARTDIAKRMENKGALPGIASGFRFWDYKSGGLIPSLLYLVAARPSMGKTAFLLCIIDYVCGYLHKPVLFFSLEMSKQQIINRLACMIAEVENTKLRTGDLTDKEQAKINKALCEIEKWPLILIDTPGLSLQDISAKARKTMQTHKDLALICLDHLTEMAIEGKDYRQGITENVRGCKRLAKQLNIPFVLLCQLNRAAEGRTNHRPILADLRETGAIEEVADVISFLYRDNYYNPEADPREAELLTMKNRDGELGPVNLHWYANITKFKTPQQAF